MHLTREKFQKLLRNRDVADLDYERLGAIIMEEPKLKENLPENLYTVNPLDGTKIVFNSKRAHRPRRYATEAHENAEHSGENASFIVRGDTTRAIDSADLSEGFTFINFNLFPVFQPGRDEQASDSSHKGYTNPIEGIHFLQWTSNYQSRDWHNMPLEDCIIVLQRVSALEKALLADRERHIYFFKNFGNKVGGSIPHGHQQIGCSDVPGTVTDNLISFEKEKGVPFSRYVLDNNSADLTVFEYESAVLLIPYFMKRPYSMMLLVKDSGKRRLHELQHEEQRDIARGWKDGIILMRSMMRQIGRDIAFNITAHTGPGCGIYFDFLPYTQETGGFEHLGMYVCQGCPFDCAEDLRNIYNEYCVITTR